MRITQGVITATCSIITTWFLCPNGESWFSSYECSHTTRNLHLWAVHFSAAFFLVDFILVSCFQGVRVRMDKMLLVHHFVLGLGFYLAVGPMEFLCTLCCTNLMLETSTPFASARWLMFDHGCMGDFILQRINTVVLFCAFFYGRIFF